MNILDFWKDFEDARVHASRGDMSKARDSLGKIRGTYSVERGAISPQHLNLLRRFIQHYGLGQDVADQMEAAMAQAQANHASPVGLAEAAVGFEAELRPQDRATADPDPELREYDTALHRDPSDIATLLSAALRYRQNNPSRARQILARVATSGYPEAQIASAALVGWLEEKVA